MEKGVWKRWQVDTDEQIEDEIASIIRNFGKDKGRGFWLVDAGYVHHAFWSLLQAVREKGGQRVTRIETPNGTSPMVAKEE